MRMTQKKREADAGDDQAVTPSYTGKLELAANSQPFEIEAYYWTSEATKQPQLRLIGDTGGDMLLMRRSYPLQATLARTGDAACKGEKPVS